MSAPGALPPDFPADLPASLPARADFPPGFLFGTATSATQIEGSASGGAGPSHWDSFAATPGTIQDGSDAGLACDHLTHWPEDLDLAAQAGFDLYRFSTNWARVLPEGRGAVNPAGLDFYDRLVDGILARGMKPALTLYHWDLPAALAAEGGWQNRDIAGWMADYAALVQARLGDRLFSVATLNEPWCVAWLSHVIGAHAPGLRDLHAGARAMHHTLVAHARMQEALRAGGQRNLGIVLNFEPASPLTDSPEDRAACTRFDAIWNRWFISALCHGRYPDAALEGLARWMPRGWEADMAAISAPLDWLGVNNYTARRISAAPGAHWPALRDAPHEGPQTTMGWSLNPAALRDLLIWIARDFTGDLPLYITENGCADLAGQPPCGGNDPHRIAYLGAYLRAARDALRAGVPLRGYVQWSLLDNWEWALGYSQNFGIVAVDRTAQGGLRRTPKASYHALQDFLRQRAI